MVLDADPSLVAAYLGAMSTGLLHGLEPGHGWPLTVRESVKQPRPLRFGAAASLLLSAGHFISTLVVVMLFFVVAGWLGLLERPLFAVGGALLIAVGVYPSAAKGARRWVHRKRHEGTGEGHDDHNHQRQDAEGNSMRSTMSGIFLAALVLGFVHEEEFALIGFVAAGANALVVGLLYGISVTAAIVGATSFAILLATKRKGGMDERRLKAIGHMSSAVMIAIGAYFLLRAVGVA